MKFVRYGEPGHERPGVIDSDGGIRELSGHVADIAGSALSRQEMQRLSSLDIGNLPRVSGTPRLGPCVGNVGNFIAVGLNYEDHAAEVGIRSRPSQCCFTRHVHRSVEPTTT